MATPSPLFPPVTGPFSIRKQTPVSYVVWSDGTNYHADSMTGAVDYTGTESGTVIQSANDAIAVNGGRILVREGTFLMSSRVKLSSGVLLEGLGIGTTILKQANSSNLPYLVANKANPQDGTGTGQDNNIVLANMTLDQNGVNNALAAGSYVNGTCAWFLGVNNLTIRNCLFKNALKFNLFLQGSSTNSQLTQRVTVDGCHLTNALGGFDCLGGGTVQVAAQNLLDVIVAKCFLYANTGAGIGIEGVGRAVIADCNFNGNNTSPSTTPAYDCSVTDFVGLDIHDNFLMNEPVTNALEAIQATTVNSTSVNQFTIHDNYVDGPAVGIHVKNGQYGLVHHNILLHIGTTGIKQDGGSSTLLFVTDNHIPDAPTKLSLNNAWAERNNTLEPQGVAAISVGASPFTYTNSDFVPETVYIIAGSGGTVSQIAKNSVNLLNANLAGMASVLLMPNEAVTVTYATATAVMNKDRK